MSLIRRTQIESILGAISSNNSSTTPLISGGVFTGENDEVSQYKAIGILVHSDVGSAVDGLSLQWSTDGVNWDHKHYFTVYGNTDNAPYFQVGIAARYFRVVYTNGSQNQSEFRLQTILHPTATISENTRLSDSISSESLVTLSKNVIAADTVDMGYRDIVATRQGRLKVSEKESDEGNEWTYINSFQLPGNYKIKFLIVPPPSGSQEKLRFTYKCQAPRSYSVYLYEDVTTISDGISGTIPLVANRFREYNGVPAKTFETYQFPSVAASGSQIGFWYIDGGGQLEAGVGNRPGDFILKSGSKYLVTIKNEDNDPQYISLQADFTL
jgi:hypothetical protein